jgi:ectoine hydroxylase-related dioxygenase (phytanoyl-CoA dioxygenase family)
MERVREAMRRYPLVDCVMKPGDALFFHANLLHASARNDSDQPRWSMICCYNARSNDPYKEAHHPRYTPLKKVGDAMIKKIGRQRFTGERADVAFLEVQKDASATSLKKKPR